MKEEELQNVLHSYISHPIVVINVCNSILGNWETEIAQDINKVYGKPNKGSHIRLALGHPELNDLAKKTAIAIVKAKENNTVGVPEYLFEVAEKIVKEDFYPDWNLKADDESNTE